MNEAAKCEGFRDSGPYKMFHSEHFNRFIIKPGLDIGCNGGNNGNGNDKPAFDFTGIDLNHPGYDGLHLPFGDGSFSTVHSSHVLEHIEDWKTALTEWFRVLKIGGCLILKVPHHYLYEKKATVPSAFNKKHLRFYSPGDLLAEIEMSLEPNSYRLVYCRDNDTEFNYELPPKQHSSGCYEVECVIKKIPKPTWKI